VPEETATTPTIVIIYPHIAHYRLGVFRELMRERSVKYSFITGTRAYEKDIPVADMSQLQPLRIVKNVWVGPFLLQPYVLLHAVKSKSSASIFVGDARYLSTWIAALILRLRGRSVYFWTIGWHRPEKGLKRLTRILFYRLANGLLLYGEVGRMIGLQMGYSLDRMDVIWNSSDVDATEPAELSLSESGMRTSCRDYVDCSEVVGAVVRPNSNKRLDLLIEAVQILRTRGRDVGVIIAGEGPCRESLQQLASTLGVPASLPGPIYLSADLQKIYNRLIVTVVPEALGLTAIQSLWYGCPVITCDDKYRAMPEHECIKPGVTGDFYAADDVTDLADTIERWILRSQSDALRISQDCRDEVVANWTASAHAHRITRVMVRLCSLEAK
jgi:glycosyltransferase involved in cell wall biosynthesis